MTPSGSRVQLQKGTVHSLAIHDLAPKGLGVSESAGRRILVRGGLSGETVTAEILGRRKGALEAVCRQVQEPSPDRVPPRCGHFGVCGGCDLQHLSVAAQQRWKQTTLEQLFKEAGFPLEQLPIPLFGLEDPWAYRNKVELSFGQSADGVVLGFHRRKSFHRIVDVRECAIAPPGTVPLVEGIRTVVNRFDLKAYDPIRHDGFWRHAVIRYSRSRDRFGLVLMTHAGPREPIDALAEYLEKRFPALELFYWGINTGISDVAVCEKMTLISGKPVLEDQVGKVHFEMGPMTFVQPNLRLAETAYRMIAEEARLSGTQVVYDLYCGIGLIALTLAPRAKVVYGVESGEENIDFAQRSARRNGAANTLFIQAKVEDVLLGATLFRSGPAPDVIVIDPPRAGLHKTILGPLLQSGASTFIYLSCNPFTLVRDLKLLLSRDSRLRIRSVRLFDFFPQTSHMEVLVTLERGSRSDRPV